MRECSCCPCSWWRPHALAGGASLRSARGDRPAVRLSGAYVPGQPSGLGSSVRPSAQGHRRGRGCSEAPLSVSVRGRAALPRPRRPVELSLPGSGESVAGAARSHWKLDPAWRRWHGARSTAWAGWAKTQLALKYALDYRDRYAGVWWFRAESEGALQADAGKLCEHAKVFVPDGERPSQALKRWLEREEGRWLLVFDDAAEPDALRPHLPQAGNHHSIVTSRNPVWGGDCGAGGARHMDDRARRPLPGGPVVRRGSGRASRTRGGSGWPATGPGAGGQLPGGNRCNSGESIGDCWMVWTPRAIFSTRRRVAPRPATDVRSRRPCRSHSRSSRRPRGDCCVSVLLPRPSLFPSGCFGKPVICFRIPWPIRLGTT